MSKFPENFLVKIIQDSSNEILKEYQKDFEDAANEGLNHKYTLEHNIKQNKKIKFFSKIKSKK